MATDKPRIQVYLEPELYQRLLEWKEEREISKISEALNQLVAEFFGVSQSPIPNPQFPMTEQIQEMIDEACEFRFREIFSKLPTKPEINARIDEYLNQQQSNEFNLFRVEFKNEAWLQMKKEFAIWNESLQKAVDQIQSLEKRIEILEPEGALLRKLLSESVELAKGVALPSESPSSASLSPEQLPQDEAPGLEEGDSQSADVEGDTEEEFTGDSLLPDELPGNSPRWSAAPSLPEFLNAANLARRLRISKSVISRRKSEPNFEEWSKRHDPAGIGWRFPGKGQRFFPAL